MAAKKKAAKAGAAAVAVKNSPYVQRVIEDEELRQNLWQAYESARDAASRLSNGKSPTKADLRRQEAPEGPAQKPPSPSATRRWRCTRRRSRRRA